MATINYNKESIEELTAGQLTILDFYADWCGPCKMLAPVFEKLSNEMTDIKFVKVNVDDHEESREVFGVKNIPTLILFKDGKELARHIGFIPEPALVKLLNENK